MALWCVDAGDLHRSGAFCRGQQLGLMSTGCNRPRILALESVGGVDGRRGYRPGYSATTKSDMLRHPRCYPLLLLMYECGFNLVNASTNASAQVGRGGRRMRWLPHRVCCSRLCHGRLRHRVLLERIATGLARGVGRDGIEGVRPIASG